MHTYIYIYIYTCFSIFGFVCLCLYFLYTQKVNLSVATGSNSGVAFIRHQASLRSIMAPSKCELEKLPKPCAELLALLKASDLEATVENILKVTSALEMGKLGKAAFSALNTALKKSFPDKHKEFMDIHDDGVKRGWLASFLVSPTTPGIVSNKSRRINEREECALAKRMTIEEYGQIIGSEPHARL